MACLSEIAKNIENAIKHDPKEYSAYDDLLSVAKLMKQEEAPKEEIHAVTGALRRAVGTCVNSGGNLDMVFPAYKDALLLEAPDIFDSYLLYLEIDREPAARFYMPRRKILYPITCGLQDLVDDKLDELFLSQPPRTGKSTMLMFFISWILGRDSEKSNLYSAYSDTITTAFYRGLLEVMEDPYTYNWSKVFPNSHIVSRNAAEETLDIDRRKRYHSFTARSLYGTLNGATDCSGILISDDLIGGIEEALNPDRMISAWSKVDNNLLTRAKQGAKILWCGTRWSMTDPIGLRMELLETDQRFANRRVKIINLPALNGNGESNFDYDYGVGFTTEYYIQRRASFEKNNDLASWNAQYMQEPVEREGTLFMPSDFRYYNGTLPDGEPDRAFMAVDPAFGGGDFVASPVCYQYGEDIYVVDAIYNNGDKKITVPLVVKAAVDYKIRAMQIEGSKSTITYKNDVEKMLKQYDCHLNLISKPASTHQGKLDKIFNRAPEIRDHMIFLEADKRSKMYEQFMQNVFSFKYYATRQHDDAPDSLAQAIDMSFAPSRKPQIFTRTF